MQRTATLATLLLTCCIVTLLLTSEGDVNLILVGKIVTPFALIGLVTVFTLRALRRRRVSRACVPVSASVNQAWAAATMKLSMLESIHGVVESRSYDKVVKLQRALDGGTDVARNVARFSEAVDRFEASLAK